jgi:hypothetical protein
VSEDTFSLLQQTEAELVTQIKGALADGGKKEYRRKCDTCGHYNVFEVSIFDADEKIKALSTTSQAIERMRKSQKGDDASEAATKILRDRSALSDEELAEYIARLENELSRDAES